MMTLLFGLFVMLFSIASENKGKFDEQLQLISESRFSKPKDAPADVVPKPPEPVPTPGTAPPVTPPSPAPPDLSEQKALEEKNAALVTEREELKQKLEDEIRKAQERETLAAQLGEELKLLKSKRAPKDPNTQMQKQVAKLEAELQKASTKS